MSWFLSRGPCVSKVRALARSNDRGPAGCSRSPHALRSTARPPAVADGLACPEADRCLRRLLDVAPSVEGGGDDCVRRGCLHQHLACCRIIWRLGTRIAVETVVGGLGGADLSRRRE